MNKFMKKKFLLAVLMMSTCFSAISVTGQAEGTSLQSIPQESYDLYGEQTVKEEVKTSIEKALKAVAGLTDQEKEWLKKYLGVHYISINDKDVPGNNYDNAGAVGDYSMAIGRGAYSEGVVGIAMGVGAVSRDSGAIAFGSFAKARKAQDIAIGYAAKAEGSDAIAIGTLSETKGETAVTLGAGGKAYGPSTVSIGGGVALASSGIAIGNGSLTEFSGEDAVAVGSGSCAIDSAATAVGTGAVAFEKASIAVGAQANAIGGYTVAVGAAAQALKDGSTAFGVRAKANESESTAMGMSAQADVKGSVAIGSFSKATVEEGTWGYDPLSNATMTAEKLLNDKVADYKTLNEELKTLKMEEKEKEVIVDTLEKEKLELYENKIRSKSRYAPIDYQWDEKIKAKEDELQQAKIAFFEKCQAVIDKESQMDKQLSVWKASKAAVSVGNDELHMTRQITGVAAGTNDTDAVNVAQLKKVVEAMKDVSGNSISSKNEPSVTKKGIIDAGNQVIINVAEGKADSDAVNVAQLKKEVKAISENGISIKDGPSVTKTGIDAGNQVITNVKAGTKDGDAVNFKQFSDLEKRLGNNNENMQLIENKIGALGSQMSGLGAGVAALAGLHPLDYDSSNKWDLSIGYGNYKDAHAVALGAYYRPNAMMLFSIGSFMSGSEKGINAGISLKVGKGQSSYVSKGNMAEEIQMLKAQNNQLVNAYKAMEDENQEMKQEIQKLKEQVERLVANK